MSLIKTGKFVATGSDVNLDLGFIPDYLKLMNQNAAAREIAVIEWFYQLGATKEFQFRKILDNADNTEANFIVNTSTAEVKATFATVSVTASPDPVKVEGERGVTIDASWMDDSDVIYYIAIKSDRDQDLGDAINW